jgi:hypothetical protein
MQRIAKATWTSLAVLGLAIASPAHAAVPGTTLIEGALTATGGGPAADGTYNITFLVYKEEVGGNPVWAEGPLLVGVKNGLFTHALGSNKKLDAAALAALPAAYLAMKIESDPELPHKQMHAVAYAQVAAIAGSVDCSGCIKAGNIDSGVFNGFAKSSDLSAFAKTGDLAKVAVTGAFSDLSGGPDLSGYAKKTDLAKVATTGSYGDLTNLPTLADVAKSGSYADLKNLPALAKLGAACGTNLVMKGIKADGSYDCVESATSLAVDDISKGLMFFGETYAGTSGVKIPDNRANSQQETDIAIDKIAVPSIGVATKLSVTVELAKDAGNNGSNVADKRILLVAPDNTVYTLFCGSAAASFQVDGKPLCATSNNDKDYPFLKVYPSPDAVLIGDLTTWIGKNVAGTWTLKVHDYGFNGNGTDGKVNTWSINIHTYGTKKLNVKATVEVEGGLKLGNDLGSCDAKKEGTLRYNGGNVDVCQSGSWTTSVLNQTCPWGSNQNGICVAEVGCGNCNFRDSASYCAKKGGDICSDSQTWTLRMGSWALHSNANWTNSFADNDSGEWSEANGGTGDDHSWGSGWTATCCYNYTPYRSTDKIIKGVRLVYLHDNPSVYWRQAASFCNGMNADLCSKQQYQILRNEGVTNGGWGYWASDHSDNDGGQASVAIGDVSDNPNLGQHWGFACCATHRKTLACPSSFVASNGQTVTTKDFGGVCTTKINNSDNSNWKVASTECANLDSKLCTVSQTAWLRQQGAVNSSSSWTESYSDNDSGNPGIGVGNAGDNHSWTDNYGYACCLW